MPKHLLESMHITKNTLLQIINSKKLFNYALITLSLMTEGGEDIRMIWQPAAAPCVSSPLALHASVVDSFVKI